MAFIVPLCDLTDAQAVLAKIVTPILQEAGGL
jgi:hypothetical protein